MLEALPVRLRGAAAILASAALSALYVRGGAGWVLGFVLLVPFLRLLDASPTLGAALLRAWAMSVAFTAAAFAWFGTAFGAYVQVGEAAGLALLLLGAPLFQPQFIVFALVRQVALRRHGALLAALAAAAAWVAAEWLLPKLLGDTLGYGLHPSRLLRQGADLGGGAGLTLLLLLSNEAIAAAWARRTQGWRAAARPLALGAAIPLLLAGYGAAVLSAPPAAGGKGLRVALIQSNIAAYERERRERGAYAAVRAILDTHFAMSYDAVVRQKADAVLWPETAYPTTFARPKSEAGAAFDSEIAGIVNAAGVPFIFGTYDRDSAGEYNAAAFMEPGTGLLGFYRKTHLFPFTEYVPEWIDGPLLRRLLPWTGNWRPGNGARVFPLRLADGREVPVLPLICLDDVKPGLAIDGARLGARAILTMSNDSWFSASPLGARLHQTAAAFRSIETRLPQFRATTSGSSAAIGADGAILAAGRVGERTLVVAEVAVRTPPPTLMTLWGDWVGKAAGAFLLILAACSAAPLWRTHPAPESAPAAQGSGQQANVEAAVAVLPPALRLVTGVLRAFARASLLWMCVILLLNDALRANTLTQVRMFAAWFLAPEAAAWCLLYLYSARAWLADGQLMWARFGRRTALALDDIASVQLWRLPFPGYGMTLRMRSGPARFALALANPRELAAAIAAAGGPAPREPVRAFAALQAYSQAALARRRSRLDSPLLKYLLLPLALAIPAFHLQQQIAYGGPLGEYYSFGLKAYLLAFAIWWAAWTIAVVLSEAVLRLAIETATLLAALLRPRRAAALRHGLQRAGHAALFIGFPAWLLLTVYRA